MVKNKMSCLPIASGKALIMRCFLITGVFFLGFKANAQLRLIYNENFLSNKANWPTPNDADHVYKIENGVYALTTNEDGGRWVYTYPAINPNRYFTIETKIKVEPNSETSIVGIVWDVDAESKNLFYWYRNGNVGAEKRSVLNAGSLGYEASGLKFDDGKEHVLKVKSFSNRCEFYIDDKLVKKVDEKLSCKYGNGVGVYLGDKTTLKVDYIKIYQEREPINLIETDFKVTNKENLGKAVNTYYSEVQPIISHDGGTLYFTRKEYPKNTGGPNDDIWYSVKNTDNTFTTAENLGRPVNNSSYNAVAGFSADAKKMVVVGKYNAQGGRVGDGFCEFTKTESGWGNPKNLDMKNFYNLNEHQEASYSPDGTVLILTIERRDTYGGKDIYVSLKQADGTWSAPFNAGHTVNSFADEVSPFLAGDNKTLYFASEGHSGYGDCDIFMTRRLDDTWKNWSKPVNMGPEINSKEWDAYFTIDAKGEWAYMVSNHHSVGKTDIFRFKIPNELKPDSVAAQQVLAKVVQHQETFTTVDSTWHKDTLIIQTHTQTITKTTDTIKEKLLTHEKYTARIFGKVYDAKTKEVLKAPVVIRDMETHKEVYSDGGDLNGFSKVVEEGHHYDVFANYTGYVVEHVDVDLITLNGNVDKQVDLYLVKFEKDQTVVMSNVQFEEDGDHHKRGRHSKKNKPNEKHVNIEDIQMDKIYFEERSSTLRYCARGELTHVAALMKENPTLKISIGGHTQMNDADPKFNKKLSTKRAKAVYDALVKMGVDKKRMTYVGYGHDKPLYDVNSAWENAKNRRVDFTIVSI